MINERLLGWKADYSRIGDAVDRKLARADVRELAEMDDGAHEDVIEKLKDLSFTPGLEVTTLHESDTGYLFLRRCFKGEIEEEVFGPDRSAVTGQARALLDTGPSGAELGLEGPTPKSLQDRAAKSFAAIEEAARQNPDALKQAERIAKQVNDRIEKNRKKSKG